MSLRISCPHCGRRPIEEFEHAEIPQPPAELSPAAQDLDRGFFSGNEAGIVEERWFHSFGCRRWLTLRRDTRTDSICSQTP